MNRQVWLATGGTYVLLAAVVALMALVVPVLPGERLFPLAAVMAAAGAIQLRAEPPAIGSVANHLVIACVYLLVAVLLWAFQPGGGAGIAAALFIGPLTALRLQDRREIAVHTAIACALLGAIALAGLLFDFVDQPTLLAAALLMMVVPVSAISCVVVLEAAEVQADELEALVRRDPLTGVGNERHLQERLANELVRHERTQRSLSLISLDLNGFRALNDLHGHAAGDELLQAVATALTELVGDREAVVRHGGDQFSLLLPDTSANDAIRAVQAVHGALSTVPIAGSTLTAGVGVASYPHDALDAEVLLHVVGERLRADKPTPDPVGTKR